MKGSIQSTFQHTPWALLPLDLLGSFSCSAAPGQGRIPVPGRHAEVERRRV